MDSYMEKICINKKNGVHIGCLHNYLILLVHNKQSTIYINRDNI